MDGFTRFTLTFCCDNAAFEEGFAEEIRAVLARTAEQVDDWTVFGRVRDTNGNRIGFWQVDVDGNLKEV
jgi:hypothetical protein